MADKNAKNAHKRTVTEYFNNESEKYARIRDQQWSFISQENLVLEFFDADNGMVLEAGCGIGTIIPKLVRRGCEVWGVDLSARMIACAKNNLRKDEDLIHLSTGDIENLDFPDEYFDAIVAMGVLEYMPTYDIALKEMYRTLKRGGQAIITIPNKVCPYRIASRFASTTYKLMKCCIGIRKRSDKQHLLVNHCSSRNLDKVIAEAGFEKVDSAFCNFAFYPLDRIFPKLSLFLNKKIGVFSKSRWLGWLGTQYVIKFVKR